MPRENQKGQLTIFFAITILFFITCVAFVVNVGMFVKARINLQNAVDAAAFSGAAVQARQLTNISYLNWEMRNSYKEWMFKYYVLGTASNPKTQPSFLAGLQNVDFRLRKGMADTGTSNVGSNADLFNIPSVCIKPAGISDSNICAIYHVPGLPRFSPIGLSGVDDTLNEFTNVVVEEKTKDCIKRGVLNFLTALVWIYGTGMANKDAGIFNQTMKVAWDRPGSYITAFEMAFRMRNLEKLVNISPKKNLCVDGERCTSINLYNQLPGSPPTHERTVKAFWAAFRNLETNNGQMDLKNSFKLSELGPRPIVASKNNLNGMFNPQDTQKFYLDLYAEVLNLVNFYTLFTPRTGEAQTSANSSNTLQMEGTCPGIKTALPVPAYPFGFFKNPDVLTYYAVKGEAKYTGIFNPFGKAIHMEAYAAAKPFGGRIGPKLFSVNREIAASTRARENNRSFPYFSGILPNPTNTNGVTGSYVIGYPIPVTIAGSGGGFWATSPGQNLGGVPQGAANMFFGIPNLIYDLGPRFDVNKQMGTTQVIQIITENRNETPSATREMAGLYSKDQFVSFKSNLGVAPTATIGPNTIKNALIRTRTPTLYESMNYLIPTRQNEASHPAMISPTGAITLYAPLWSDNAGVSENNETYYPLRGMQQVINNHLELVRSSVERYETEMKKVAETIRGESKSLDPNLGSNVNNYMDAASSLADQGNVRTCKSIAGRFYRFFYPQVAGSCPDTPPLNELIYRYWDGHPRKSTFKSHHIETYSDYRGAGGSKSLMNAYLPGPMYGARQDGYFPHPFNQEFDIIADRNFYSTKLIPISAVTSSALNEQPNYYNQNFTIHSEGRYTTFGELFLNPLEPTELRKRGRPKRPRSIRE